MSIYTKFGDQGNTKLLDGKTVSKSSLRVDACGSVDELCSVLGVVISFTDSSSLNESLSEIQRDLFVVGADLASKSEQMRFDRKRISGLEKEIDAIETSLPRLTHFLLPGGSKTAALLHHARTVCRRTERVVVSLSREDSVNPDVVMYLNRLGDLLFVQARFVNHQSKKEELLWKP